MLTFIVSTILICLIAYIVGFIPAKFVYESKKTLKESKILERFNKALKSLKTRNLDSVKEELIDYLNQYSMVKEQQFAFSLAQIRKSLADIEEQTKSLLSFKEDHEYSLERYQEQHKGSKDTSILEGAAKIILQCKTDQIVLDKLQSAEDRLREREAEINNMLNNFNSSLAVKKAEIAIMVADSTGIFSGSTIDLRLDSLIKEFQDKVIEGKAAQDVHNTLNNKENNDSVVSYEKCLEEARLLLDKTDLGELH